jgi:hypothetical protein
MYTNKFFQKYNRNDAVKTISIWTEMYGHTCKGPNATHFAPSSQCTTLRTSQFSRNAIMRRMVNLPTFRKIIQAPPPLDSSNSNALIGLQVHEEDGSTRLRRFGNSWSVKIGKSGTVLTSQLAPSRCVWARGLWLYKASLSSLLPKQWSCGSLLRHNINTLQLGDSIPWKCKWLPA